MTIETKSIILGLVAGLVIGVVLLLAISQSYEGTISNLISENTTLGEQSNYYKTQLEQKVSNTALVDMQVKELQETSIKCFWATEYQIDLEGATKHFGGKDYSKEYISSCEDLAEKNWELLISD
jgi:hypothetical protein